jgi:hypothetical protein
VSGQQPGASRWDPVPDLAALIDGLRELPRVPADQMWGQLGDLYTGPYTRLRGGLLLDEPGREGTSTADAIRDALREAPGGPR